MSALPLIEAVLRAGGAMTFRGDRLRLSAPEPLPQNLLDELQAHKAEVIDHLRQARQLELAFTVDALRQAPVIHHWHEESDVRNGTSITVVWPESACSMLAGAEQRFLQIANDYTWLNPHLALTLTWFGECSTIRATDPSWRKWRPSDPTCPHWYTPQHLERLIAAYLTHDMERGNERTVRAFVSEFRGLSGSLKQKAVLAATGLQRAPLARLCDGRTIDRQAVARLLDAMIAHTRPVKAEALGILGRDHLHARLEAAACEMASFQYKQVKSAEPGLPWVIEAAFAWCPDLTSRLITGVNWSPGIVNPFRALGPLPSEPRHRAEPAAGRSRRAGGRAPAPCLSAG